MYTYTQIEDILPKNSLKNFWEIVKIKSYTKNWSDFASFSLSLSHLHWRKILFVKASLSSTDRYRKSNWAFNRLHDGRKSFFISKLPFRLVGRSVGLQGICALIRRGKGLFEGSSDPFSGMRGMWVKSRKQGILGILVLKCNSSANKNTARNSHHTHHNKLICLWRFPPILAQFSSLFLHSSSKVSHITSHKYREMKIRFPSPLPFL